MPESLFNKVADWRHATLLKRGVSDTGVFLWNLRNLLEHLFWRTSANNSFPTTTFYETILASIRCMWVCVCVCVCVCGGRGDGGLFSFISPSYLHTSRRASPILNNFNCQTTYIKYVKTKVNFNEVFEKKSNR